MTATMPIDPGNARLVGRYWACPINISGLDREDVAQLIEDDLFDLLRPTEITANAHESIFQVLREAGQVSYGPLHDVVETRLPA